MPRLANSSSWLLELTIPVLNEEKSILNQLAVLESYVGQNLQDFGTIGFVIADNGSTDRTSDLARNLAARTSNFRYVRIDTPGVGAALKESWGTSRAQFVGYLDLDLATDLKHLRQALEIMTVGQAEIVNGSRLLSGSIVLGRKWNRTVLSKSFNRIVRIVFRVPFSDGMCGFKILDRAKVQNLLNQDQMSNGWFFATELLIRAERLGLSVVEIPVTWTDDQDSKVRPIRLSAQYLLEIWRLASSLRSES